MKSKVKETGYRFPTMERCIVHVIGVLYNNIEAGITVRVFLYLA